MIQRRAELEQAEPEGGREGDVTGASFPRRVGKKAREAEEQDREQEQAGKIAELTREPAGQDPCALEHVVVQDQHAERGKGKGPDEVPERRSAAHG